MTGSQLVLGACEDLVDDDVELVDVAAVEVGERWFAYLTDDLLRRSPRL